MKNRSIIYLLVFLSGVIFQSCKKGEDDPGFSLLSRKARMAGNWQLKSGTLKLTVFDASNKATIMDYKFGSKTFSYASPSQGQISNIKFHLELDISKNGDIVVNQTMGNNTVTINGTWDFTGKVGGSKNKDGLKVLVNSTSEKSIWLDQFNKSETIFTYKIRELRDDKLVLFCTDEFITDSKSNESFFISAEYVFEPWVQL